MKMRVMPETEKWKKEIQDELDEQEGTLRKNEWVVKLGNIMVCFNYVFSIVALLVMPYIAALGSLYTQRGISLLTLLGFAFMLFSIWLDEWYSGTREKSKERYNLMVKSIETLTIYERSNIALEMARSYVESEAGKSERNGIAP